MSKKINVISILSGHVKTLRDATTNKMAPIDLMVFFVLPLLASVGFAILNFNLKSDVTSILVNFGAIFTALLLSVLVLVYDQGEKLQSQIDSGKMDTHIILKKELLNQLYFNICYSIVVSIFLVFTCLAQSILSKESIKFSVSTVDFNFSIGTYLLTPVIVFLISNLLLTILMIVKRMHTLLESRG
jgi:hypothetical protein